MKRINCVLVSFWAFCLLFAIFSLAGCQEIDSALNLVEEYATLTENSTPTNIEQAQLVRVVDGDTAIFTTEDPAEEFRVRFVGVDAPEMGFQGSEYEAGASEATSFVEEKLDGSDIWLEYCVPETDRFGRVRAFVWIEDPTTSNPSDSMINAQLVKYGHAEAVAFSPHPYEDLFEELQEGARASNLGIWGQ